MTVTLFGLIWLILCSICFCLRHIKYLVFMLLLSAVLQCDNVFMFNGVGIGPQIITAIIFSIRAVFSRDFRIYRIRRTNFYLLMLIIFIIVSLIANKTLGQNILVCTQIVVYAICFLLLEQLSLNRSVVMSFLDYITLFVLILGLIQYLITSGLFPRISIVKILFFNDNSSTVYFNYDNYKRLCSTFMEPSYCVCFLLPMFFYYLSLYSRKNKVKPIIFLVSIFVEIILSKSTTGYVALVVCGIIYLICSKNFVSKKLLIGGALFCIISFFFLRDILDDVIFKKLESGSAHTRFFWDEQALRSFKSSILFGVGYKNIRGNSLFTSILGQIGLFGMIAYVLFNFSIVKPIFMQKEKLSNVAFGIIFTVISVILCQLIACPDLDLCAYWLILWVIASSAKEKSQCFKESCPCAKKDGSILRGSTI